MALASISHVERLIRIMIYVEPDKRVFPREALADNLEKVEVLLSGEVFYPDENGVEQRYGKGAIFWHRSGESDIFKNTVKGAHYRCAAFTFRVNGSNRPVPAVGQWQDLSTLDGFVNEASDLFMHSGSDNEFVTIWIYAMLLRQFITLDNPEKQTMPVMLAKALLHINTRIPNQIPIKELASRVGYSTVQLHRVFMQKFGMPPGEYILRRRLLYAANLLLGGLAIPRIAEECGFRTVQGFYSAFRKIYGTTPRQYRSESVHLLRINNERYDNNL